MLYPSLATESTPDELRIREKGTRLLDTDYSFTESKYKESLLNKEPIYFAGDSNSPFDIVNDIVEVITPYWPTPEYANQLIEIEYLDVEGNPKVYKHYGYYDHGDDIESIAREYLGRDLCITRNDYVYLFAMNLQKITFGDESSPTVVGFPDADTMTWEINYVCLDSEGEVREIEQIYSPADGDFAKLALNILRNAVIDDSRVDLEQTLSDGSTQAIHCQKIFSVNHVCYVSPSDKPVSVDVIIHPKLNKELDNKYIAFKKNPNYESAKEDLKNGFLDMKPALLTSNSMNSFIARDIGYKLDV
ncbi:hypothetical protein ABXV18_24795 [Vibrio owensii]|uniref:hypothetical protein n=1 Tax=Vibrio owensii TaxID=696485 RepID=UPI003391BBC8